jgi:signal transduction histidine kinase
MEVPYGAMSARGRTVWLVHGLIALCALLILGAMAALTRGVIKSEGHRAGMEAKADEQEQLRLALWRMDAAAAAWIAEEAQRPVPDGKNREPSGPEVKLRFDAREDGLLLADDPDKVSELCVALDLPTRQSAFPSMCSQMPEIPASWAIATPAPAPPPVEPAPPEMKKTSGEVTKADAPAQQQQPVPKMTRASQAYQTLANTKELGNRSRVIKGAVENAKAQFDSNMEFNESVGSWSLLRSSLPRPARIGGELLLLRHLQWKLPNERMLRSIQGVWLDEPALKNLLLAQVADLFPGAKLVASSEGDLEEGTTLASFPWKLAVARPEEIPTPLPRSVLYPLIAGWGAALVAIFAAWLLVTGLLRLSERRASFVSAVTHELRTPLTTFQLYSDMLASGAVKEEKRGDYFHTLRREAERLSHLVENVLAFSRIERRCERSTATRHVAGPMVESMLERFRGRLKEAGMNLVVDLHSEAWPTEVKADPAAVEHVLFNLIDNAAKYGAGPVTLDAERTACSLKIRVSDQGKGIPASERKRIFRAFHKSAAAAAESRPGVGLGLALSRRLARAGGGNLEIASKGEGTCFVLTLPRA